MPSLTSSFRRSAPKTLVVAALICIAGFLPSFAAAQTSQEKADAAEALQAVQSVQEVLQTAAEADEKLADIYDALVELGSESGWTKGDLREAAEKAEAASLTVSSRAERASIALRKVEGMAEAAVFYDNVSKYYKDTAEAWHALVEELKKPGVDNAKIKQLLRAGFDATYKSSSLQGVSYEASTKFNYENLKALAGLLAAGKDCPPGTPVGTVCLASPLSTTDFPTIVGRIINTALGLLGSISLLMFIYGGVSWLTAYGSTEKIQKGKDIMTWATLGLVLIFASFALVRFVLGAFTRL